MTRRPASPPSAPRAAGTRTARGYTIRDFCEREGIDRTTCWRWLQKGVLRASRVGPRLGVRVAYADDPEPDR